jgi:hypothetical protein
VVKWQTKLKRWAFAVSNHLVEQAEAISEVWRERQFLALELATIRHFENDQEEKGFVRRWVATRAVNLQRSKLVQPV